ncbi:MAG: DUF47 family protein [Candidatus Goldbacteria bacterium]|nr:DUF47 family protein [Candidatus Goldiibacteriota bacterium]
MFEKFLPQDFNFFEFFDKEVNCVSQAVFFFNEIINKGEVDVEAREKMRDIEHEGDKIAYSIIGYLNKTFITPFDREDIHELAKKIDDVNDILSTIVSRLKIYKIKKQDAYLIEFGKIIEKSISALSSAVKGLRNTKNLKIIISSCLEMNKLESESDKLRDKALEDLFDKEKDPIEIIKWKEIYLHAETVLDICKASAHVIESILVKQV